METAYRQTYPGVPVLAVTFSDRARARTGELDTPSFYRAFVPGQRRPPSQQREAR